MTDSLIECDEAFNNIKEVMIHCSHPGRSELECAELNAKEWFRHGWQQAFLAMEGAGNSPILSGEVLSPSANQSEIRYNRNQLYKDIGDAIEKHDKRSDDESRDEIDYIIEAILPYLRQPEPVIGKVSLKKAALGVAEYSQCRICELSEKPCIDHFDEAKFVLDAAGVNYVD